MPARRAGDVSRTLRVRVRQRLDLGTAACLPVVEGVDRAVVRRAGVRPPVERTRGVEHVPYVIVHGMPTKVGVEAVVPLRGVEGVPLARFDGSLPPLSCARPCRSPPT